MSAIGHFIHFSIENRDWLAKCFKLQDFPDATDVRDLIATQDAYLAEIADVLLRDRCETVRAVNLVLLEAAFKRNKAAFDDAVKVQGVALDQVLALTMLSPQDLKKITRKDKQSDPQTVKQNVEICDLRKQDRKKWSLTKLGAKYGMKRQSVSRILKGEKKWRKLFAELFPN